MERFVTKCFGITTLLGAFIALYKLMHGFDLFDMLTLVVCFIAFCMNLRQLAELSEREKLVEEIRGLFPINNTSCKYFHGDFIVGQCAVNPYGPCQDCKDYKPCASAIKRK